MSTGPRIGDQCLVLVDEVLALIDIHKHLKFEIRLRPVRAVAPMACCYAHSHVFYWPITVCIRDAMASDSTERPCALLRYLT